MDEAASRLRMESTQAEELDALGPPDHAAADRSRGIEKETTRQQGTGWNQAGKELGDLQESRRNERSAGRSAIALKAARELKEQLERARAELEIANAKAI